jgi:hypothetical protein
MSTHKVYLVFFFLLQLMERFRRLQAEASFVAPLEVENGSDKAGTGGCSDVAEKVGTGACLKGGKASTEKSGRGKAGVEKTTRAGKDEEGSVASKSSPSIGKAPKWKATKGAKGGKGKISGAPPSLAPSFAITLPSTTKSPTIESITTTNLLGAGASSSERVVAGSLCLVGLLVGFIIA